MDAGTDGVRRLRSVRTTVRGAGERLAHPTPESVDHCRLELETAVRLLAEASPVQGVRDSMLAVEVRALEREVDQVRRLLRQAAELYLGWASMLAAAAGGYGAHGETVPMTPSSGLSLEG